MAASGQIQLTVVRGSAAGIASTKFGPQSVSEAVDERPGVPGTRAWLPGNGPVPMTAGTASGRLVTWAVPGSADC
jgi:hypothetical protein